MDKNNNAPFSFKARWRSFYFAFNGLCHAIKSEHNLWLHAFATAVVIVMGFYCSLPVNEWVFLLLAIGLVWVAELLNTALENLADAVSQEENQLLGLSKDIAAAAVLIAALIAAIVGAMVFIPYCL